MSFGKYCLLTNVCSKIRSRINQGNLVKSSIYLRVFLFGSFGLKEITLFLNQNSWSQLHMEFFSWGSMLDYGRLAWK
jgi:hypothetical protein